MMKNSVRLTKSRTFPYFSRTMNVPKDQIWNLLRINQVVAEGDLPQLQANYLSEIKQTPPTAATSVDATENGDSRLLRWLFENKHITRLHFEVLEAGGEGPFLYGDYMLLERVPELDSERGTLANCRRFSAKNIRTGHLVQLQFLAGNTDADRERWSQLVEWADRRRAIESANINAVYQTVLLPSFRFLVLEQPAGSSFQEKLPSKSRLPWAKACRVAGYLAQGLSELHQRGLYHENLWPGNVFLIANGMATIQLDFAANLRWKRQTPDQESLVALSVESPDLYLTDNALDAAADWYSLGCILYRLVSGKPPGWDGSERSRHKRIDSLAKLEIPKEVQQVILYLTSTTEAKPVIASQALDYLRGLSKQESFQIPPQVRPPSHFQLYQLINRERPPSEFPRIGNVPSSVANETVADLRIKPNSQNGGSQVGQGPFPKKRNRMLNLGLATGTACVVCLIGTLLVAWGLGSFDFPGPKSTATTTQDAKLQAGTDQPSNPSEVDAKTGSGSKRSSDSVTATGATTEHWLEQTLLDGNDMLLWESPTLGRAIDWFGVPSAPDFVLVFRPTRLLQTEAGELTIQSLGLEFNSNLERWEQAAGVELSQIDQLIVSLHSDGTTSYQPCFVVRLTEPVGLNEMLSRWKAQIDLDSEVPSDLEASPEIDATPVLCTAQKLGFWASLKRDDDPQQESDGPTVTSFVMAEVEFLRSALERGMPPMGGSMGRLANQCDGDRHFNLFFIPRILSNEQSKSLFAGTISDLRIPLMLFFDDRVDGALFSMHFDQDCYWELRFDRSSDIKGDELANLLTERLRQTRDRLVDHVARLPNNDYWNNIRVRWAGMLQFVYSFTRIGTERGEAIVNGWLPAVSAHNLLASAEIMLSAGTSSSRSSPIVARAPQSLEELLQRKRNLKITSSPDLVNLLSDLQNEILDDFPDLPFEFEIRLMGSDLEEQGITQNQRPGEISMPDNSLAEILTEICFQANPDKNATNPADERCKLVWMVPQVPEGAGQGVIFITTRKAAEVRGDRLPDAFRSE